MDKHICGCGHILTFERRIDILEDKDETLIVYNEYHCTNCDKKLKIKEEVPKAF